MGQATGSIRINPANVTVTHSVTDLKLGSNIAEAIITDFVQKKGCYGGFLIDCMWIPYTSVSSIVVESWHADSGQSKEGK